MNYTTKQNKAIVVRFNKECLEQGNPDSFKELLATDVINHAAPDGMSNGFESFSYFINEVLRKGFPDLRVEIADQVAEDDLVTSRKNIVGTHTGEIFGIPPSNKGVVIKVLEIIRLRDGKYAEHWGQSNFSEVIHQISSQ